MKPQNNISAEIDANKFEVCKNLPVICQKLHKDEIPETAAQTLQVIMYPLNNIELIMRNAESFWKELEELCKSLGNNMKRQLDLLANKKAQKRKIIWQTKEFKKNALMCYVKWIALQNICIAANEGVCSTIDVVEGYATGSLNEEGAIKYISTQWERKLFKKMPHVNELPYDNVK